MGREHGGLSERANPRREEKARKSSREREREECTATLSRKKDASVGVPGRSRERWGE